MNIRKDNNKDITKSLSAWDQQPKPVLVNSSAWVTEDADMMSLENLLLEVERAIATGGQLSDILQRRALSSPYTTPSTKHVESSVGNLVDFFRVKEAKPYIGIRNIRAEIHDSVYYITRSKDEYPGKSTRVVSLVQTCMIHLGLHVLDQILTNRPKVVDDRLDAIRKGSKEKRRRGQPPQYTFVNFTETMDKQQNIACLSPQDYARAVAISVDYAWPLSFVIQIAMIIAIANSEALPSEMVKNAREEVKYLVEYLDKYYK